MNTQSIGIGLVLRGECVGFEPIDDGVWHVWFGPVFLGRLQYLGRKKVSFKKNLPFKKDNQTRAISTT
jgi:hypothetical protein